MEYIDYPIAKTKKEVEEHLKKGGEVWQEISDDLPNCTEWDSWQELEKELFYDIEDKEDISDYNLHLIL